MAHSGPHFTRPDQHLCARCGRAQSSPSNTYAWSVLLRGAGPRGGRALATVGAENSYFNATVLLPVVSGLFIVHRLVFAESDDLNAVHGHIVLRHKIRLHGLGAAAAPLQIVLGGA